MNWHKPAYCKVICLPFLILVFFIPAVISATPIQKRTGKDTIIVKPGYTAKGIAPECDLP